LSHTQTKSGTFVAISGLETGQNAQVSPAGIVESASSIADRANTNQ